jgi:hypothetical protein
MAIVWSVAQLAQLYRRLDVALEEFEAYCHHAAAAVAPRDTLWQAEAAWAAEARLRMRARATDWIEYATNRDVESLRGYIERDNA